MADRLLEMMQTEFSPTDLPGGREELIWIIDIIGWSAFCRILCELPGISIYVGKELQTHFKRLYARKHYDGRNSRALALRLGVCERLIFKWVSEKKKSNGTVCQMNNGTQAR